MGLKPARPRPARPPLAALAAAALRLRCPVCREGRLYASWFRMALRCPSCSVPFEREEGFFVGSIYVGYALTLAVGSALLAGGLAAGWPLEPVLAAFVLIALVLPLLTWRVSRAVWLALDQYLDPREPPPPHLSLVTDAPETPAHEASDVPDAHSDP